ncbi:nucleotide exchange factor RasGEF F [Pelomyxa schiedti]|nr:nucleotide exchange factor RasGEF F [Pelomyxa schiedti]
MVIPRSSDHEYIPPPPGPPPPLLPALSSSGSAIIISNTVFTGNSNSTTTTHNNSSSTSTVNNNNTNTSSSSSNNNVTSRSSPSPPTTASSALHHHRVAASVSASVVNTTLLHSPPSNAPTTSPTTTTTTTTSTSGNSGLDDTKGATTIRHPERDETDTSVTATTTDPTNHLDLYWASYTQVTRVGLNMPGGGRHGHSGVSYGGCIYLFGGQSAQGRFLNDLLCLRTTPPQEVLLWNLVETTGSQPLARHSHTCVVHNGTMILFGGMTKNGPQNDLYTFKFSRNRWSRVEIDTTQPYPPKRWGHKAVVWHGKMFVFGGFGTSDPMQDLWILSLDTLVWMSPLLYGTPPSPRGHHAMEVLGKRMFVHGGFNGVNSLSDMHCLRLHTLSWSSLRVPSLMAPRKGHTMTVMGDFLVLCGGRSKSHNLDDVWAWSNSQWFRVNQHGDSPKARYHHVTVMHRGSLIMAGGAIDSSRSSINITPPPAHHHYSASNPTPSTTANIFVDLTRTTSTQTLYSLSVSDQLALEIFIPLGGVNISPTGGASVNPFSSLSEEIRGRIFLFLPAISLAKLLQVDKFLFLNCGTDYLWERLIVRDFGIHPHDKSQCMRAQYAVLVKETQVALWLPDPLFAATEYQTEYNMPPREPLSVVVIGESHVGKTTLISHFIKDYANDDTESTFSICSKESSLKTHYTKVVTVDGSQYFLDIRDIEQTGSQIPAEPVRQALAVLLLYDTTNRASFDAITKFYLDFILKAKDSCSWEDDAPAVILTGTKCDLNAHRQVTVAQGCAVAKKHNIAFFETSVPNRYHVVELFTQCVREFLRHCLMQMFLPKGRRRQSAAGCLVC